MTDLDFAGYYKRYTIFRNGGKREEGGHNVLHDVTFYIIWILCYYYDRFGFCELLSTLYNISKSDDFVYLRPIYFKFNINILHILLHGSYSLGNISFNHKNVSSFEDDIERKK